MTNHRKHLLNVLARIEQLIAEAEAAAKALPLDDSYHGRAVEALNHLRQSWERTQELLNADEEQ